MLLKYFTMATRVQQTCCYNKWTENRIQTSRDLKWKWPLSHAWLTARPHSKPFTQARRIWDSRFSWQRSTKTTSFWDMCPCGLISRYRSIDVSFFTHLRLKGWKWSQDHTSKRRYLQSYKASYPRKIVTCTAVTMVALNLLSVYIMANGVYENKFLQYICFTWRKISHSYY